ncbi:phasin [Chelatococcus sp. SYSU_G07232]|uniref:Phasin n=1 Tax=Chelatococcus albus TaxID=3047466 RepID=A0ABT7AF05_9HYPH|nr:phasin [Chelatococcus sp. SYSU_G07232]MDJ1157947.1 phasin [Chelatococcus sp. SYSU_G07232]
MSKGIPNYEIPTEMRDFAEKSVEQARKAFDGFIGAAHKTVDTVQNSTLSAQTNAQDAARKTLAYVEQNIGAAFDLAQKLVRSRDLQEALQHQADYLRAQFAALQEQVKDFNASVQAAAQKAAAEATRRKA